MTQQATVESPREGLGKTIGHVAAILCADSFPTGERAALRRLDPNSPASLAFYRFAFRHLPENWECRQSDWMALVAGIALMCPHTHRPDRPAGQSLAESGYAEARLERMLSAEGETLRVLLLRAARFLAANKQACNWTDLAWLLLATDHERREQARLNIARAYYRNLKDKE